MKTVLSPSDVAHYWANQLQDHARNSGNTFYFEDDKIYSYGKHFCIAKHVTNARGEKAVLFTTRGYSNTTAKHIRTVQHACNHLNVIYCNDPSESYHLNMEAFLKQAKYELKGLQTARKPEKYIVQAERILEQARKYVNWFATREGMYSTNILTTLTELIESAKTGEYAAYLVKENERIIKEREESERKALKAFKLSVSKWRKFKGDSRLFGRLENIDYLRINGKRIETSQGVQVPLETAKKAYQWLKRIISKGGCTVCKYKILDFEVSEVTANSIKIGCHNILFKEIEKIATTLKW